MCNTGINAQPAATWLGDDAWINFDFIPAVARHGAVVIAAGAPPRWLRRPVRRSVTCTTGSPEFSRATGPRWGRSPTAPTGYPRDWSPSFPVTIHNGDWQIVQNLEFSAFPRHYNDASVAGALGEAVAVKELGFVF